MKTIFRIVLLICVVVGVLYTLFLASVQQSFRNCPPTEAEIIKYPELKRN